MKYLFEEYQLIEKNTQLMRGVFSLSDLRIIFGCDDPVMLNRRIRRFEEEKLLTRFCRGYYIGKDFNLEALAARIYPDCCISFGNVLAHEAIIGSVPAKTVYAIKTGHPRKFAGPGATIVYFSIAPHMLTGFRFENSIRYAVPEKALLDTLYFYQKGSRFSFDLFSDIDRSRFDRAVVADLLKKYRNPKFVSFVKGYMADAG